MPGQCLSSISSNLHDSKTSSRQTKHDNTASSVNRLFVPITAAPSEVLLLCARQLGWLLPSDGCRLTGGGPQSCQDSVSTGFLAACMTAKEAQDILSRSAQQAVLALNVNVLFVPKIITPSSVVPNPFQSTEVSLLVV